MRLMLFPAASLVITAALVFPRLATAEDGKQGAANGGAEIVTLSPFSVMTPSDPGYLEHELAKYGLQPLATESVAAGEERFRFLWVRSFNRPALFEVHFAADGSGVYEAKLWEEAPDGGRWVVQCTKCLASETRVSHRERLGQIVFFELPFYDGRGGYDGATWLFEAREGERSHAVYRWSPEAGPLRELGVSLIEAAIPSEFVPIY